VPASSSGSQQLLLQIRNSSVKSLFHYFSAPISTLTPNGAFDAINIGTTSRQLQVGGQFFPNLPINDVQRPAEGYSYLIQALGGSIAKSYGTVIQREMYNTMGSIASVPTGADSCLVLPSTANTRPNPAGQTLGSFNNILDYPCSAFYGYDLEKTGGVLFSGLNTRASPPFLNLFLGSTLGSSPVNCQSWGLSDVVMVIDTNSKSVQAFI
jgi:hypothetical protein